MEIIKVFNLNSVRSLFLLLLLSVLFAFTNYRNNFLWLFLPFCCFFFVIDCCFACCAREMNVIICSVETGALRDLSPIHMYYNMYINNRLCFFLLFSETLKAMNCNFFSSSYLLSLALLFFCVCIHFDQFQLLLSPHGSHGYFLILTFNFYYYFLFLFLLHSQWVDLVEVSHTRIGMETMIWERMRFEVNLLFLF